MELKQIKELMTTMGRTGIKRLTIKKENFEIVLERSDAPMGRLAETALDFPEESFAQRANWNRTNQALSHGSEMPGRSQTSGAESPKAELGGSFVTSPMVGTFYITLSPDEPPLVKVGDRVEKNTVVCVIEAMKVMNEIKANVAGKVVEILVDTGQPVEFGTKLFRIVE